MTVTRRVSMVISVRLIIRRREVVALAVRPHYNAASLRGVRASRPSFSDSQIGADDNFPQGLKSFGFLKDFSKNPQTCA
jgi:hypothetical protein